MLAALGVDVDGLVQAVEKARREGLRSALLPPTALLAECDAVRLEKEAAVEAQEFDRAAELRDRERQLLNRALAAVEGRQNLLRADLRRRLGMPEE